jgi:hypothetical protein
MNGGAWEESTRYVGVIGADLIGLLAPRVHAGQLVFANAMRRAIHAVAPDVFDHLDFDNDEAFLEPLAIAEVSTHSDASHRRAANLQMALVSNADLPPSETFVTGDRLFCAFVPGRGFVGVPDQVPSTHIADMGVGSRGLLLLPYPVAAFERAVFGEEGRLGGVESAARQHRVTLDRALYTLEDIWPELMSLITETVRYLVLFEDPGQNSFASRATHGVAYLNVALGHSVAFLIEDLAHQCGHVLFSSAWEGGEALLSADGDAPISGVTGHLGDHRTLEAAVHGIVTLTLMLMALERYIDSSHPIDGESAEATARLVFALYRLGLDIGPLASSAAFSAEGKRHFEAIVEIYDGMLTRYRGDLTTSDFTGQGYNFDYAIFRRRNSTWAHFGAAEWTASHA